MSVSDSYRLTHPELMSEETLREILKNSCIEIGHFEKLRKAELLELYRRVALPLPQRQHGRKNLIEIKIKPYMTQIIPETQDEKAIAIKTEIREGTKRTSQCLESGRLKPPIYECGSVSKKIRLSIPTKADTDRDNQVKRKNDESVDDANPSPKKRQKITWP